MTQENTIVVLDPKKFEEKKVLFKKQGANSIHVVTDFDRTLTPCFSGGKKINTVIAQLRNNDLLGEEYSKKAFALHAKYHPIEIDSKLSLEEKVPKMQEWWSEHLSLMVAYGISKNTIEKVADIQSNLLREGFNQFFLELQLRKVPVLILSAALGDVIKQVLFRKHLLTRNVHIISDFFAFDKNGKAIGYVGNIVHVFNKNESQVSSTPYASLIEKRKNIILLGDTLADLGMVGQIPYEEIITIGFLNEKVEENLEEFKKNFDVVILGDGSLNFVNNLLKELFE